MADFPVQALHPPFHAVRVGVREKSFKHEQPLIL
jgi:hypothetical protein